MQQDVTVVDERGIAFLLCGVGPSCYRSQHVWSDVVRGGETQRKRKSGGMAGVLDIHCLLVAVQGLSHLQLHVPPFFSKRIACIPRGAFKHLRCMGISNFPHAPLPEQPFIMISSG